MATTSNGLSTRKRHSSNEVNELNVKRLKPNDDVAIEELQKAYNNLKRQLQSLKDAHTETSVPKTTHLRKRTQNVSFCIKFLFSFKSFEFPFPFQGYNTSRLC